MVAPPSARLRAESSARRGRTSFGRVASDANHVVMDATDLALLLSGIELASVKRRRRYSFDAATQGSEATGSRND